VVAAVVIVAAAIGGVVFWRHGKAEARKNGLASMDKRLRASRQLEMEPMEEILHKRSLGEVRAHR
jgi:hypothetical protein